jgi:hypothetical protein
VSKQKQTFFFDRNFWNTVPIGNELVFIGSAHQYTDQEQSIREAVEDAAWKVALFYSLEATSKSRQRVGSSIWDYSNEKEQHINFDVDYKKYVDDLSYNRKTDVLSVNNAVFVKTRYNKSSLSSPAVYIQTSGKTKPVWIDQAPYIAGYVVEVGYASSLTWLSDTVKESFENAAFSVIKAIDMHVGSSDQNYTGSGAFERYDSTDQTFESHISLNGFYVLDSWLDPETNSVYTLAIAKNEVQNR